MVSGFFSRRERMGRWWGGAGQWGTRSHLHALWLCLPPFLPRRIMSALEQNAQMLRNKRAAFEAREAEAARRKAELDVIRAKEEQRKRDEEARKERERQVGAATSKMCSQFTRDSGSGLLEK